LVGAPKSPIHAQDSADHHGQNQKANEEEAAAPKNASGNLNRSRIGYPNRSAPPSHERHTHTGLLKTVAIFTGSPRRLSVIALP
jgi:hypothetical protein